MKPFCGKSVAGWTIGACWLLVVLNWLTAVADSSEVGLRSPSRPKVFLETSAASTPVTGKTIEVGTGGDFQTALNQAQPGDEIVLRAGATYTGNFRVFRL